MQPETRAFPPAAAIPKVSDMFGAVRHRGCRDAAEPVLRARLAVCRARSGCSSGAPASATRSARSEPTRSPPSTAASRRRTSSSPRWRSRARWRRASRSTRSWASRTGCCSNLPPGYGLVGIAVALMGRGHPVGIVLASLLFGMLYQGGSRTRLRHAEDHPGHDRGDPGAGGAVRGRARRPVQAPAGARPGVKTAGADETSGDSSTPSCSILASSIRLAVPLLLRLPGGAVVGAGRAWSISGSKARCSGRPSRRRSWPRSPAAPGRDCWPGSRPPWRWRWCMGSRRSTSAAIRSCPARPSTWSRLGLTALLGNAWYGQGGRTPPLDGAARFQPMTLPGADAVASVPVLGPIYAHLLSGHEVITYLAFLAVPLTWLRAVPDALRPAAAGSRARTPRRSTPPASRCAGCAMPGWRSAACCAASPAPTSPSPSRPASCPR